MSSMVKLLCSEVGVSCHNSNEHLAFVINYLLSSNVRDHKIGGEQQDSLNSLLTLGIKETLKVWESCGPWSLVSTVCRLKDAAG